ncbi:MAG TPA: metallophosphoesterase, partial [Aggregatilineales bacterium]|nr:metallophosphoesterase [Aggregatilineales bacterium]
MNLALALGLRGAAIGMVGLAYSHTIEPNDVEIVPLTLTLPRLAPDFHGFRIAQISDIHMGGWMSASKLAHMVDLVNAQKPDLVAITGDFVTGRPVSRQAAALIGALGQLDPRADVVAVLGNHDYWSGAQEIRGILRRLGIHEIG